MNKKSLFLLLIVGLLVGVGSVSASELSITDSITSTDLDSARSVFVVGDYAYVASVTADSLTVIDVSDPSSISITDSITSTDLDRARSVFVLGDYAYVASYTADSLTVIDISDPTSISITDSITSTDLNTARSVFVLGDYAYVASLTADSLTVIDISDTSSISITDSITSTDLDSAHSVFVVGDYAYVASLIADSLTVIDASYYRTNNFSITGVDSYTTGALTNFSALISGTTYSTTNGTINTPILDNSTSLYNITISSNESGGYFTRTYNDYNVSSALQAELHQAEISFIANNRVTGTSAIEAYSFTVDSLTQSITQTLLGGLTKMKVNADNNTYNFSFSGNYYPLSTNIVTTALSNTTQTIESYDHKLNVTVSVASGGATENNFTIDLQSLNYSYSETLSTTNGFMLFNLTPGTYNLTLNDSVHELQTETVVLNDSVNFTSYDFDARTARTFDIEFFNETTNQLLSGSDITAEFISDSNSFNVSTNTGTLLLDLLTPDAYTIKYSIDGSEVVRDFFVTLNEQSYQEIDLYLIDEEISAYYVAVVVDASNNACQQNTVSLLRYYVSDNQYKVVEMSRSNSQGQAVFRVKPNNVDYKFLFDGSCGTFTSAPTRLIDSTNSYTITGGQELLESLYAITGASTSLTYVNGTETFAYTWTSDSNIITQGCLTVLQRNNGVRTVFGTDCATGNTGTASVTINDTNQTTYFASGKLFTSTTFSDGNTNELEVSFVSGFFDDAQYAPFAALIIFVAVVLALGSSASGLVIGSVASLIGLSFFSFISVTAGTIFSFITIGVAILYLARGRGA